MTHMQTIEVIAVAAGLVSVLLIAIVSMRSAHVRRRRAWRDGAFIPGPYPYGSGDDADDGVSVDGGDN